MRLFVGFFLAFSKVFFVWSSVGIAGKYGAGAGSSGTLGEYSPFTYFSIQPGMFVKVRIEFDRHDHATVVPREALIKHLGEQGVFVADAREEIARFVPVTTGIINGRQVEILKPPLTGSVVTLGQHLLEDGAAIILPSETQKSPAQKKNPGKNKKKKKKK